jgi:PPE-repeat protein
VNLRGLPAIFVTTLLLAAPIASVRADGPAPAVSALNGKISTEGGATGADGQSSGVGIVNGSITTPLGHAFGLQVDGLAGTAFNSFFGGGTAHLFWRDPAIGLIGPVAMIQAGSGVRLGWYGAEAELYAGIFTFGAWGGYHEVVDNQVGLTVSSGFYAGSATVYPIPDLALSISAGSEFNRANGTAALEFQPDLFARHNVSFFVNGALAEPSAYSVTAGIRFYFGPDKPLIRRHREDDPPAGFGAGAMEAAAGAWASLATELNSTANGYQNAINGLTSGQWQGPSSTAMSGAAQPYVQWLQQNAP